MNRFLEKLKAGKTAIGTHISFCDSTITELIGSAGFDYLWIDTEHTAMSLQNVQEHLIAAKAVNVSAIVRVPWNDPVRAKPILEMGPDGIIFPQVNSYEEAQQAVASCHYPPDGIRGYGPRRAIMYGMISMQEYLETINNEMACLIQIENIKAVQDIDRITSVPGIHGLIIGPCDLAASMGHILETDHPDCINACVTIIEAAKKKHIPIGMSLGSMSEDQIRRWKQYGINFLSLGGDAHSVLNGAVTLYKTMHNCFCSE